MATVRKTKCEKDVYYLNEKVDRLEERFLHTPDYKEVWVISIFIAFLFFGIAILIYVASNPSPTQKDFCNEKFDNFSWSENTGDLNPKYFMCNVIENNTIIKKYVTYEEFKQWKKTK